MKKLTLFSLAFILSLSSIAQLNMTLRSHKTYPGMELSNIWGYSDSIGREFALVGTTAGLSIVNVTNPDSVYEVAAVAGTNSIWREVKTRGKYAYVTTEACCNGLQIINLSYLPDSAPSKYYTGDGAIAGQLARSHALHISDGYAYIYGCRNSSGSQLQSGSAIILNLTTPWNPVYVGNSFNAGLSSNYVHDGFVSNDTLWAGNIYGGYFSVFNVANKAAPVLLNTQTTPGDFTHNTWLTTDHKTLLTTDEVSNSYLAAYDVHDVNNISLSDKIQSTPGNGSIIHNVTVKNNFAVASYYTEGVVVFDVTRPGNLCKVGFFDTSPSYTGNGYNGCWGVYPLLPSGNILASDIETGLYVLTPTYQHACFLEGIVTDSITGLPIAGATVTLTSTVNENTSLNGTYTLSTINSGTYNVTVSKSGYATKIIAGVLLTNGILTTLNIQLALPTITVSGNVLNGTNNAALADVHVRLNNGSHNYETLTISNGYFTINNVIPGNYDVTFGKWKFETKCFNQNFDSANHTIATQTLFKKICDDFSFDYNWVTSGAAKSGKWLRGVPIATTYSITGDANPGYDVSTDCNNLAFVTGNGGGIATFDDVDSGTTILTSPIFSLIGYVDPYINYSRWFFASPGSKDTMFIKISNGTNSVVIDTAVRNTTTNSKWQKISRPIKSYISLSNKMKVILTVRDRSPEHVVEAGFDGFSIIDNFVPLTLPLIYKSSDESFIESIYPNPFTNFFNLNLNIVKASATYCRLTDVTGRIILEKHFETIVGENSLTIETSGMSNGIYLMEVKVNEKSEFVRLVKSN